ncbi:hypothetical protein [Terribacillus sp. DMT04]|uniref:hypothetical protein n=1 Tax=Terribacillus sp. DMT04 TaxID=2850441 RepID=UPI001C2C1B7B|nr:hypothetical protein [Terribacillus sp. DMT04]QXE02754.1 hypothetical protein KS242_06115 [Terribacillus sp. DMT04]
MYFITRVEQIIISKKTKKLLVTLSLAALILIVIFIVVPRTSVSHDKTLEASLHEQLQTASSDTFDFGDHIDYEWKEIIIFPPYTDEAYMKEKLGMRFHDPADMSLRDDLELVVVVKNDGTFAYAETATQHGYLAPQANSITPENDVIGISKPS